MRYSRSKMYKKRLRFRLSGSPSTLLPPEDQEKRTPGTPSMTSGRRKRRLVEVRRFCNNSIAKESMFTLMETGIKHQLETTELISILSLGLEVEGPGSVGKHSLGVPRIA